MTHTCTNPDCERSYIDTASGRHIHKIMYGHAPSKEKKS